MGLSQEKFGELFAKTKGNVSAWENGRRSPSIDQVCSASARRASLQRSRSGSAQWSRPCTQ